MPWGMCCPAHGAENICCSLPSGPALQLSLKMLGRLEEEWSMCQGKTEDPFL